MNGLSSKNFNLVLGLAFLALILNAATPLYSIHVLKIADKDTSLARDNIKTLDSILLNMLNAETGSRGFVITGNAKFLQPYYSALDHIEQLTPELNQTLLGSKELSAMGHEFKKRIYHSLERLEQTNTARQLEDPFVAYEMVKSGEGKKRMDAVRFTYNQLLLLENNKLEGLKANQSKITFYTKLAMFLLTFIDLVLFGIAFKYLMFALKKSVEIQDNLNVLHNETLTNGLLLNQSNYIKSLQAKLNEVLQIVITDEEAFIAIANYGRQIFPKCSGAFYVRSNSKDYFEKKSQWGDAGQLDGFEPHDCWSVRSNNVYFYDETSRDMPCKHNSEMQHKHFVACFPTSSADEMIGVLVLIDSDVNFEHQSSFDDETVVVAKEVVSHIGLAITNLRLRESLKRSSFVDALTGIYNRRYLDETLTREIARSHRAKENLGIIMLDVDHFKTFNDTYGHEAGDLVLKEVGALLKQVCRASDIPCRYGGEEFVLVIPDADITLVKKRAEEIRLAIKTISITYGGEILPAISISAGVSAFPEHTSDANEIVKMADDALYFSKKNGRDQVSVYKG